MSIRQIGRKLLGNYPIVRELMYFAKADANAQYQRCVSNPKCKVPISVRIDMLYCLFRYGCIYDEYFFMGFNENRSHKYRNGFVTDCRRFKYFRKWNKDGNLHFFNNKQETYRLFKPYYHRQLIYLERVNSFPPLYLKTLI